uniref:Transmembrane channel-like protein n=1 Tax=Varanus komodoensis TaxID=61221 RepID=A0A8D2L9J7_VARKO
MSLRHTEVGGGRATHVYPLSSHVLFSTGHFGTGIQAYFIFLRFLVLMNLVASLLVVGFVVAPNAAFEALQLNRTHQSNSSLGRTATWESRITSDLNISTLPSLPRSIHCLKRSLVSEDASFGSYSNKVFAGWDFGLMQDRMVELRHKSIRYELRMDLEEAALQKLQAERTTTQRISLYVVRALINIVVLGLLGGSFYCIFLATGYSQSLLEKVRKWLLLDTFYIYIAIYILPFSYKGLKQHCSNAIFMSDRSVFLRLASLVVVLISLWAQITCNGDPQNSRCQNCGYDNQLHPCWETSVGQEMYKLMIFDVVIVLLVILFVEFPRNGWLCGFFLCLCVCVCVCEFMVPSNVLDLVYGQTLCWTGALFCPLLPVLNTFKFIAIFYLKKLSLFSNCRPAEKTFRASSSNFFFLLVLLIVYHLLSACGPFRDEPTMWNIVVEAVLRLPHSIRDFLHFLGSLAFAVPLFLLLSIIMFYLKALADSYSAMVKSLKGQLRLVSGSKGTRLESKHRVVGG